MTRFAILCRCLRLSNLRCTTRETWCGTDSKAKQGKGKTSLSLGWVLLSLRCGPPSEATADPTLILTPLETQPPCLCLWAWVAASSPGPSY
eukprot:5415097-Amphidinium_carterae.1